MTRVLLVAALVLVSSVARADAPADVAQAFTGFVASLGTDKPAMAGVELFIPPGYDDDPLPDADTLAKLRKALPAPKLSGVSVRIAPSGKAAWLVGQIAAHVPHDQLRASAVLVRDDAGWHVRATEWSVAVPNRDMDCGAIDYYYNPPNSVPADLVATVNAIADAFDAGHPGKAVTVMSDDKGAIAIGSAPGELFTGGAQIKSVFKKWWISAESHTDDKPPPYRANIAPAGDLMWIAMPISSPPRQCTMYRALFVLAKESAGWRIVNQHYAEHYSW
jgi:hypothetical protein